MTTYYDQMTPLKS